MIHKVIITQQGPMGITLGHEFERIIETEEEAEDFGREANRLWNVWNEAFAERRDDDEGDE